MAATYSPLEFAKARIENRNKTASAIGQTMERLAGTVAGIVKDQVDTAKQYDQAKQLRTGYINLLGYLEKNGTDEIKTELSKVKTELGAEDWDKAFPQAIRGADNTKNMQEYDTMINFLVEKSALPEDVAMNVLQYGSAAGMDLSKPVSSAVERGNFLSEFDAGQPQQPMAQQPADPMAPQPAPPQQGQMQTVDSVMGPIGVPESQSEPLMFNQQAPQQQPAAEDPMEAFTQAEVARVKKYGGSVSKAYENIASRNADIEKQRLKNEEAKKIEREKTRRDAALKPGANLYRNENGKRVDVPETNENIEKYASGDPMMELDYDPKQTNVNYNSRGGGGYSNTVIRTVQSYDKLIKDVYKDFGNGLIDDQTKNDLVAQYTYEKNQLLGRKNNATPANKDPMGLGL